MPADSVMPAARSNLCLLAGGDTDLRIAGATEGLPADQPVVVAARAPDESARRVARAIRHLGHSTRLIAPAESLAATWWRARSIKWSEIDVGDRAGRLTTVTLPDALASAPCVVAVNAITPGDAPSDPIAIGLWARFAHPRQRTGARLSDPRDGLTADIALAVNPRLVVLVATWHDIPILIASPDQVIAELAGLALRQLLTGADLDTVGPWEHPLVQRATELDIGIATPAEIQPELRWLGTPGDPREREIHAFAVELFGRIGVVFDG